MKENIRIKLDELFCGECGEMHLFLLKDKNGEFSLGLQDVLKCLRFAEEKGIVPSLPSDWWLDLNNQYLNTKQWFK